MAVGLNKKNEKIIPKKTNPEKKFKIMPTSSLNFCAEDGGKSNGMRGRLPYTYKRVLGHFIWERRCFFYSGKVVHSSGRCVQNRPDTNPRKDIGVCISLLGTEHWRFHLFARKLPKIK